MTRIYPILKRVCLLVCLISISTLTIQSQTLPPELRITDDNHLISGGTTVEGFYALDTVHKIEFTFIEADWFSILDGPGGGGPGGGGPGNSGGEDLFATLTLNDEIVYDSVLIGIKGATSDFANNSEKKSFSVDTDQIFDQDILGYDNLNLNGGFLDPSGMREVLYGEASRGFTPALKANFIDLYINGEYWGPYSNVQQIEGTYIKEWFSNNDGTRWRAIRPDGIGGGPGQPGGNFGTGVSTLNYNGPDSTDYNRNYTLKNTKSDDPWAPLIEACDKLNNLSDEELYSELKYELDIDRALWFLAQEIIFTDEDSYVWKGGMDYYVYWDAETDRIIPLEVDGNSAMLPEFYDWSPFYNQNDDDFVLMNRLFANNELRQRYLAHVRVILDEYFNTAYLEPLIDQMAAIISPRVEDDPKKLYSTNEHLTDIAELKEFIEDRYEFLTNHTEINQQGLAISDQTYSSPNGANTPPSHEEEVIVSVNISDAESIGIENVLLYYAIGIQGVYERVEMTDMDSDLTFEGTIPGFANGAFVRYYVEAVGADNANTRTFLPKGAEHDVFIYQVALGASAAADVVINELMASNDTTAADQDGEFDDWVELYNKGDESLDLSGYVLSDDVSDLMKWQFPAGTVIGPDEYLIVWADDDEGQDGLHTNYKLSAGGEALYLVDLTGTIIDEIEFEEQETDRSLSRIPNGTGDFVIKDPTFGINNETTTSTNILVAGQYAVYPNPVSNTLTIELPNSKSTIMKINNVIGQEVMVQELYGTSTIDVSELSQGTYFLSIDTFVKIIIKE